jgi:hypothetical protein
LGEALEEAPEETPGVGVVKADSVTDEIRQRDPDGAIELESKLRVGARMRSSTVRFAAILACASGTSRTEHIRILVNVLGAQREVQLSRDAVEPV